MRRTKAHIEHELEQSRNARQALREMASDMQVEIDNLSAELKAERAHKLPGGGWVAHNDPREPLCFSAPDLGASVNIYLDADGEPQGFLIFEGYELVGMAGDIPAAALKDALTDA